MPSPSYDGKKEQGKSKKESGSGKEKNTYTEREDLTLFNAEIRWIDRVYYENIISTFVDRQCTFGEHVNCPFMKVNNPCTYEKSESAATTRWREDVIVRSMERVCVSVK